MMPSTTTNVKIARRDLEAVTAAVRDYGEGWYTGNAERMRRCLHPELVKRVVYQDGNGRGVVKLSTATSMVAGTESRHMANYLDEHGLTYRPESVQIFVDDVAGDIASARCVTMHYLDYIQLVKTAEGWKLLHVLWHYRGGEESDRYLSWVEAAGSG